VTEGGKFGPTSVTYPLNDSINSCWSCPIVRFTNLLIYLLTYYSFYNTELQGCSDGLSLSLDVSGLGFGDRPGHTDIRRQTDTVAGNVSSF